jgi:hypothetical protein
MKPVLSILRELLDASVLPLGILTLCAVALVGTLHSKGYRLSLYTVAPCAPAIPAAPHALSLNPFDSEAP